MDSDLKVVIFLVAILALAGGAGIIGVSYAPTEPDSDQEPQVVDQEEQPTPESTPEPTPEQTPDPTPEPTPESTPEPTPEQSARITITNLISSISAWINGKEYNVNNKPSFKVGETIHILYKNTNTQRTYENDYTVSESGNIRDEAMENALINNGSDTITEDDFPAAFYFADDYDEEIRRFLNDGARISFDDLFN